MAPTGSSGTRGSVDRPVRAVYTPAPMTPLHLRLGRSVQRSLAALVLTASLLVHAGAGAGVTAQAPGAGDGLRFGLTFGGVSTAGVVVEYFDGTRGYDLTVGTWSFHDLSVSATVKEYFGASALRPFVGAGLWVVLASPPGARTGIALVLRAPVGVDWRAGGDHYLGAALNVDRALWVRRTDPADDVPLNRRLVPLPEIYYRWSR